MRRLLVILLAVVALAACGGQSTQPAQPAQTGPSVSPAPITGVEVELRESFPVQVSALIKGELGNGCMSLGTITQSREGNVITVNVPAINSGAEVCTAQMQYIDERVELEGAFEPGVYTLIVNDFETEFTV